MRIQFVSSATADHVDRLESWSDIAALLIRLTEKRKGLLSAAERLVVEDFLGAVGSRTEATAAASRSERSSRRDDAASTGGTVSGTITLVLSAIIGALTAVLIEEVSGDLSDRTLFVLLVVALSGGAMWLTTWFTGKSWHNKWLGALAASLASLTRWWPIPAGRIPALAASSCIVGATVVTTLVVVHPAHERADLSGDWHLGRLTVMAKNGITPSARWGEETWTLVRRQPCDGSLCAYTVSASGGPNSYAHTFTLWPEGHSLLGSAATWMDCVRSQPPYSLLEQSGYLENENFRLEIPPGHSIPRSLTLTDQVTASAKGTAERKNCQARIGAKISGAIARR
jgi:hypothetical protein